MMDYSDEAEFISWTMLSVAVQGTVTAAVLVVRFVIFLIVRWRSLEGRGK